LSFQLTSRPPTPAKNRQKNKLASEDRPVHEWYRFVLSFPPHLVRDYLDRFQVETDQTVLDPFCGTGTTLVECKKLGIASIGVEAHPMPHFASAVKTDWGLDPDGLLGHAKSVACAARRRIRRIGADSDDHKALRRLPAESQRLLLKDSISPIPLHKSLVLLDKISEFLDPRYRRHELLALAKALVTDIGNLHFGPEVGVRGWKEDAPVVSSWLKYIGWMAEDLRRLQEKAGVPSKACRHDSREIAAALEPRSVDAVITSPPYPNEKDYTRTTRLESVILGFVRDRKELRGLKEGLLRSNTRNVYKADEDDQWAKGFPEIQRIAKAIEKRRVELGKTSGFERLYHRVTKLYFGGMLRHLKELKTVLRPGARLAYVVGDQASYLRIMIRTGELLAEIAESLGYEVEGRDLFRTRLATATGEQLREEVLILRWPGRAT